MRLHELKTWPGPFQAVIDGKKRHEIRVNDRGFDAGHRLQLREWDPHGRDYTGRLTHALVTYISAGGHFGLPENMCVMSIEPTDGSMWGGGRSDLRDALASLRRMLATDARDWSRSETDAWLWGVILGWGPLDEMLDADAMREVASLHKWTDEQRARLERFSRAYHLAIGVGRG